MKMALPLFFEQKKGICLKNCFLLNWSHLSSEDTKQNYQFKKMNETLTRSGVNPITTCFLVVNK